MPLPCLPNSLRSFHGPDLLRQTGFPAALLGLLLVSLAGCASTCPVPVNLSVDPSMVHAAHHKAVAATPQPLPTGSLWQPHRYSLFQDIKAHNVGDIVTITVDEKSKGSKTATTTTSREHDLAGTSQFSGFTPGVKGKPAGNFTFGPYSAKFKNSFKGSGNTSSANTMTAYMTATVVKKLPNGNLVIRGSRWTEVNNSMEQIVLQGEIRPIDISRNNTVLSQNIADARILLLDKGGPVATQQKPGWLGQLIDQTLPF